MFLIFLNLQPTTVEGKAKLVDELKCRAKGCISSRNFPAAIKLYTKAIENSSDDASKSVLHANRSMCYLNVGNSSFALDDAVEAIKLDSSYVKGYYRKASALKSLSNFAGAKEELLKGLALKPDDKEMKEQLEKLEKDICQKSKLTSNQDSTNNSVAAARSTVTTSNVSKKSTTVKEQSSNVATNAANVADDDVDVASVNMRGYKKTSDGRMTTFFNNELDETAKKLIGDIAPKRLDADVANMNSVSTDGGSVWNSAGTYEERILTPWATNQLTNLLCGLSSHVDGTAVPNRDAYSTTSALQSIDIAVTAVENVVGDAQVSMIRGKKKYMCDFSLELKWSLTIQHVDAATPQVVAGKLSVLDITADDEYEISHIEVTHLNETAATLASLPRYAAQLVTANIKGQTGELQKLVQQALKAFCVDFKTK